MPASPYLAVFALLSLVVMGLTSFALAARRPWDLGSVRQWAAMVNRSSAVSVQFRPRMGAGMPNGIS